MHSTQRRIQNTINSKSTVGLFNYGSLKSECPCCMCTNALKATFQKAASTRSKIPGERIHSDLKEVSVRSKKNYKWAICFVDDCTRRGMIYYLERKSQSLDAWRQFLEEEVAIKGYKAKYLRSDNGGEYIGEMVAFNNIRGIQPEYSPPHCQSGNGVAEVFWRDIFRLVRASLWDQQRDDTYWPTAAHFANYTRNRLLTSAVPNQVPEAAWQQYRKLASELIKQKQRTLHLRDRRKARMNMKKSLAVRDKQMRSQR